MKTLTSHYYQTHYQPIQLDKYKDAWPLLKPHVTSSIGSMLDLGIGYAWWESFLSQKKIQFKKVVGMDINEEAIAPRKKNIEYVLTQRFTSNEQFDLVVCWDAYHLLKNKKIIDFVKPNGLLLISEPKPFVPLLDKIKGNVLVDEWVGKTEQSRLILIRK